MTDAREPADRPTVLVVEDNAALTDVLVEVLADEGYSVTVLGLLTEDAVRTTVGRLEPDCMLLDGESIGDYGRSWLDAAWAHARRRPVPVVMFSADAQATAEAATAASSTSARDETHEAPALRAP